MDTDDVMDMLNDYISALVDAIFNHDGTIDKITGDGILAVFGSPEPDTSRHEKAVHAALAMQSAMAANQRQPPAARPSDMHDRHRSSLRRGPARVHRLE